MMLLTLPNELLLKIAKCLSTAKDLNSLLRANRRLADLLAPLLDKLADLELYKVYDAYPKPAVEWATAKGHEPLLRLLIKKGVDIHRPVQFFSQRTLLHLAVSRGHEDVARLLLDNGADINATNTAGFTALQLAVDWAQGTMVRLLLDRGAGASVIHRDLRRVS